MNKDGWYTDMVTRMKTLEEVNARIADDLNETGFYANELLNKNSELTEHMQRMVDTVDDIVKSLQQIERHECSEEAIERIQDAIVDLSVFL